MRLEKVSVISPVETPEINNALVQNHFKIVDLNPDFIICYGGDGTILLSERSFPQIPKLIIKRSKIRQKYDYTLSELDALLVKIRDGQFKIKEEPKLETIIDGEQLIGMNEIQVRAKLPIHTLRFSLFTNGREFNDLIGDGVIIATPFGSTGYYKSTGGKKFKEGIGVSFNNLHNRKIKSFVVSKDSIIMTKILRGPAWVLADNYEKFLQLNDNDVCTVTKSKNVARLIHM